MINSQKFSSHKEKNASAFSFTTLSFLVWHRFDKEIKKIIKTLKKTGMYTFANKKSFCSWLKCFYRSTQKNKHFKCLFSSIFFCHEFFRSPLFETIWDDMSDKKTTFMSIFLVQLRNETRLYKFECFHSPNRVDLVVCGFSSPFQKEKHSFVFSTVGKSTRCRLVNAFQ